APGVAAAAAAPTDGLVTRPDDEPAADGLAQRAPGVRRGVVGNGMERPEDEHLLAVPDGVVARHVRGAGRRREPRPRSGRWVVRLRGVERLDDIRSAAR